MNAETLCFEHQVEQWGFNSIRGTVLAICSQDVMSLKIYLVSLFKKQKSNLFFKFFLWLLIKIKKYIMNHCREFGDIPQLLSLGQSLRYSVNLLPVCMLWTNFKDVHVCASVAIFQSSLLVARELLCFSSKMERV